MTWCALLLTGVLAGCSEQPEASNAAQEGAQNSAATEQMQASFVEGKHYRVVDPQGVSDGPLVTEFFSLYCGACYNMESRFLPMIVPALEAQGVTFEQKHVNFSGDQTGEDVVRGFAILEQIGQGEQKAALKERLFEILGGKHHNHGAPDDDHGNDIQNLADLRALFVEAGFEGEAFDQAAKSESVTAAVKAWSVEQQQYQVQSVPSFIVNNRYQINMSSIETLPQLVDLMVYLSNKE
ncbi:thiol:disulfide interchange protein DsbA/DsbL [Ferrimonas gelatinilytica]|uniref:Thiol:disulfide interchange protein DsbA/DsbL n=1 Tax=Ferrimonas gelatinilytica TaxID=1255257 RepID=A0ABP9S1T0_9GAMM